MATVEGSLQFSQIENLVICFTPGARIATPRGEVNVENLRIGDRVITRDDGVQEINWIGRRKLTAQDLMADPKLRPVLIKKGSLGNNLPERDMMVSPNHRMLMANSQTQLLFDEREVLVSAKHLVGQPGIYQVDTLGTEYIHVMFERHEVILGDGSWTESFQPGDYSLAGHRAGPAGRDLQALPGTPARRGPPGLQRSAPVAEGARGEDAAQSDGGGVISAQYLSSISFRPVPLGGGLLLSQQENMLQLECRCFDALDGQCVEMEFSEALR